MHRNFDIGRVTRDPRLLARVVLGTLLLANVVAALFVFKPWGGSARDLEAQVAQLNHDIAAKKAQIERAKVQEGRSDVARTQGSKFLQQNFLDRQTTYSAMVSELLRNAAESHIILKEQSFTLDPVEGSDTLSLMTLTVRLEGTYPELLKFINTLDHSPKFLTIEYLQAAPQVGKGQTLDIGMRLNAYVREAAAPGGRL